MSVASIKIKIKKLYILVGAIILIVIAIAALVVSNIEEKEKPKSKGYTLPDYSYTYQSSDIKCQVVPSYPGSRTTINECSGNLAAVDSKGASNTYGVIFTSTFYIDGAITPLDQLNSLKSGESKLALKFFDKTKKQVKTITYVK